MTAHYHSDSYDKTLWCRCLGLALAATGTDPKWEA